MYPDSPANVKTSKALKRNNVKTFLAILPTLIDFFFDYEMAPNVVIIELGVIYVKNNLYYNQLALIDPVRHIVSISFKH